MDIEHHQSANLYTQYKSLLERARTFKHLLFYNRKLINTYKLVSNGYKHYTNRQGKQQAKCIDCGNCILLDPIVEEQSMEMKEGFMRVLSQHQNGCSYAWGRGRVLEINRRNVGEFGAKLFQEILENNLKYEEIVESIAYGRDKVAAIVGQKWVQLINKLTSKRQHSTFIFLVSLFGYIISTNKCLQCLYCGEQVQLSQFQSPQQHHRSSCTLVCQKNWQAILQKLLIKSLQQKPGQFIKTQGQQLAKKIRTQLSEMSDQCMNKLREFRYKIKDIKKAVQTMDEQESRDGEHDGRRWRSGEGFGKMEGFAEELEEFIRGSIKKIKIQ